MQNLGNIFQHNLAAYVKSLLINSLHQLTPSINVSCCNFLQDLHSNRWKQTRCSHCWLYLSKLAYCRSDESIHSTKKNFQTSEGIFHPSTEPPPDSALNTFPPPTHPPFPGFHSGISRKICAFQNKIKTRLQWFLRGRLWKTGWIYIPALKLILLG